MSYFISIIIYYYNNFITMFISTFISKRTFYRYLYMILSITIPIIYDFILLVLSFYEILYMIFWVILYWWISITLLYLLIIKFHIFIEFLYHNQHLNSYLLPIINWILHTYLPQINPVYTQQLNLASNLNHEQ